MALYPELCSKEDSKPSSSNGREGHSLRNVCWMVEADPSANKVRNKNYGTVPQTVSEEDLKPSPTEFERATRFHTQICNKTNRSILTYRLNPQHVTH